MTDTRGNTEIWNLPIPDSIALNQSGFIRHALSNRKSLEGDVFLCLAEDLCVYEVSSLNARKFTEPLATPFMCLARSSTGTLYALEPPRTLVRLNDDLNWEPCCELRVRGTTPIQGCQDMCFADCKDKEVLCILLKSPHCSIVEDDALFVLEDLSTGYLEHLHTFDRSDVLSVAASPYRKHIFPQISFFVWCMDGGLFETPLVQNVDVHIDLNGMTEDEMETIQFIRFSGKRHLYAIGPSGIFHVQLGRGRVYRSIPFASQAVHAFVWERTLEEPNRFRHLVDNEDNENVEAGDDDYLDEDDDNDSKSSSALKKKKKDKGDMTLTDEFKQRMRVVRRTREAHAKQKLEESSKSKREEDSKKRKEKEEAWERLVELRKAGYEMRKKKASEKEIKRTRKHEEDKKKRDAEEAARVAEIETRAKKKIEKPERVIKKERDVKHVAVVDSDNDDEKKKKKKPIDVVWIDEDKDAFSQPILDPVIEPVVPVVEVIVERVPTPPPAQPKVVEEEPLAALAKSSPLSRFSEGLVRSLKIDAQEKPQPTKRKKILVKRRIKKAAADDEVDWNELVGDKPVEVKPVVEPTPVIVEAVQTTAPPPEPSLMESRRNSMAALSPRNLQLTNKIANRAGMIVSSLPAYLQVFSQAGSVRGSVFSLDVDAYKFTSSSRNSPRNSPRNNPLNAGNQNFANPLSTEPVAAPKRKRSISSRSYREGSGLLILTDDHVLMKSSWNMSSWNVVATIGGEVQSLTRSSNGVYFVVDIQGNLCTLNPTSGELTMKCTLHFEIDSPVTKVRSLFISSSIGPLRGKRSFLCCVVPAAQIPRRYQIYTDVICSIDESSGKMSCVHVTTKDDVVACVSPTVKVKNDTKGSAFFYWSKLYGMYSVHEDCLTPTMPFDDTYLPVREEDSKDIGSRDLIPTLADAAAVQNSQLYQRRKSVGLAGWWNRDQSDNEITSLVFSECGNLYGAGNCLYGIFIEDGTRGKVVDFPDQIISLVWESEIMLETLDKLSATIGEDGVPFVMENF